MTGKEGSNQDLEKSMEDIGGKQESSLKLCPAEGIKLLPSGSLSMVTDEEECSLRMCPTKRKAPTAGHLKGGAIKRKGDDYFDDATVLADVILDEIEEQSIGDTKVATATQKGASRTGFSEVGKYDDSKVESHETIFEEEEEEEVEEKDDDDSDVEFVSDGTDDSEYYDDSDAEYQVVVDKASAKFNRFMERLRARTESLVFKDYTEADFVDTDDEEVCA